ncbi:ATP-binding protein [Streptomyces coriariae]|uniref:ATP-binding protein n=1 Tax=Streptomyces coriariae TaxID=2864460 RepID=UPI001E4B1F48|nr:ATP-binding protein [Streptomyces coriariae]
MMVHPLKEDNGPFDDDKDLRAVRQVRGVARGFLAGAAPQGEDAVDAVLLVMSELFTNAVRHAGGATGLRLTAGTGTVSVTVHDASTLPPLPLPLDATRPGGLGWHLVKELSADVRVEVHAMGKSVTAVVPCPTGVMNRAAEESS